MDIVAIAMRVETSQELQRLMVLVNGRQGDVEASISDVIDALLQLVAKTREEDVLGQIQAVAVKN